MNKNYWETPQSRGIGLFTDLRLYSEALELAYKQSYISKLSLMEEMPQRVKGLLFVESQSARGMGDLLREFRKYQWIQPREHLSKITDSTHYLLTTKGKETYSLSKDNPKAFMRYLTTQMHQIYTIPGWFVHRLWSLNPKGQGEIVIPSPIRDWRPISRKWEDREWSPELADQTMKSLLTISQVCPGAFPINKDEWVNSVERAWIRLSSYKQRKVAKLPKKSEGQEKKKMKTYAPRRRLSMAMQEAAVKYIFSNFQPNTKNKDFLMSREPLYPRTYMTWCPRLESLELIFYTDVHPLVPGRLIFPTSVFRKKSHSLNFEILEGIKNPKGENLWLHQPLGKGIYSSFLKVLLQEHQRAYTRVGSLYVPLLDVRDEVCRQLRLSAALFDKLLENCLRDSLQLNSYCSISLETDIREDQRSAHRLIRRPVWVNGTPHSLIAITMIPRNKKD